jgi:hypothetical protein
MITGGAGDTPGTYCYVQDQLSIPDFVVIKRYAFSIYRQLRGTTSRLSFEVY